MNETSAWFCIILGSLFLNWISLLASFPRRFNLKITTAIIAFISVIFFAFSFVTEKRFTNPIGLNGLVFIPLALLLIKGPFLQILYAVFLQQNLTLFQFFIIRTIVLARIPTEYTYLFWTIGTIFLYIIHLVLMIRLGKTFFEHLYAPGRTKEWIIYVICAIWSFSLLVIINNTIEDTAINLYFNTAALVGFCVLCYAIINTHKKTQKRIEAEFAKNLVSSSREHYQKMNELYDKLRILRHDYKYHLSVTKNMLHSGNAEEANEYLTNTENQLLEYEMKRYCHNTVLNALITSYAERCVENNIEFSAKIVFPDSLSIPDYDMCIILGNLLENAIEACIKLTENRFIALETHIKTAQFFVQVKNSFDGIVRGKPEVMTSRKTNGGLGLRSVKEVLEHYGGDLLTEWNEHIFTAYAAVKI
jgi:sensor histidine kinase YesM